MPNPSFMIEARTILALGAHPDDLELGCGATLAKLAERGAAITAVIMTNGAMGGDAETDRAAETRSALEDSPVGRNGLEGLGAAQVPLELVASADPVAVDENLRRPRDPFAIHIVVDLLAAGEDMLLDLEAGLLEHLLGANAEGAFVVGKDHPVQDGALFLVCHERLNPRRG